jgi:hypothetical protein
MPITPKAIQDLLDELESSKQSRLRAWNVLQRLRLVLSFWEVQPVPLLELCLGSFSKESPLQSALEKIRVAEQDNGSLDKVAKKMRAREKRFGCDWYFQGHHPQEDYAALEQGTAPLRAKLRALISKSHASINELANEVLSQGGWQFGQPLDLRHQRRLGLPAPFPGLGQACRQRLSCERLQNLCLTERIVCGFGRQRRKSWLSIWGKKNGRKASARS